MIKFGNKVVSYNDKWLTGDKPLPPIPPYSARLKFREGVTPRIGKGTLTLLDARRNIWDLTYENSNWYYLVQQQHDLIEILGANTSNLTSMRGAFEYCDALTTVAVFDTSNVTNMQFMFNGCASLKHIPLLNTSKASSVQSMFRDCRNVESGALAIYQQLSTQARVPAHTYAFRNCGSNTETGAAELAQIPSDWK